MRAAQRTASALPAASPVMNAASTMLDAQTLLPSISPARRSQSASNSSAAAPDRKKARLRMAAMA